MRLPTLAAFFLATASVVAAESLTSREYTDSDALFARRESDEYLYTRDDAAGTLPHALRTLTHLRRLAEDHASFVARTLDSFQHLQSRAAGDRRARPPPPRSGSLDDIGPLPLIAPPRSEAYPQVSATYQGYRSVTQCQKRLCNLPSGTRLKPSAQEQKEQIECMKRCAVKDDPPRKAAVAPAPAAAQPKRKAAQPKKKPAQCKKKEDKSCAVM